MKNNERCFFEINSVSVFPSDGIFFIGDTAKDIGNAFDLKEKRAQSYLGDTDCIYYILSLKLIVSSKHKDNNYF